MEGAVSRTIQTADRRGPRFRFGLRSLLLLIFIFACVVGAFQAGKRIGHRDGVVAGRNSVTHEAIYQAADLLDVSTPGKKAKSRKALFNDITAIAPDSWEANGGPGAIHFFDTNLSFVVSHRPDVHSAIERYLRERRARRSAANVQRIYRVDDLIDTARETADQSQALIDEIESIASNSWENVGGSGSICFFDTNLSLVVSQTTEVHRQIEGHLAQIREKKRREAVSPGSSDL